MAKNIFNTVEMAQVSTNRFDLSHDVKMSFKMGGLYPTTALECMPGDKFNIRLETLLRMAPLVAPVMHHVKVTQHFFFVPNRILWPNWEKWITGDLDTEHPYLHLLRNASNLPSNAVSNIAEKSVLDYLGFPVVSTTAPAPIKINPFPAAAYIKIWNEYYRDQNLQAEKQYELFDGNNFANSHLIDLRLAGSVYKRAWQHDYFTSCLPFAQKGDSVAIPLGQVDIDWQPGYNTILRDTATNDPLISVGSVQYTNAGGFYARDSALRTPVSVDNSSSLVGELQSTDIASLRRAFRLQEWLEKNARGGTRYIEHVKSHFGVSSSDKRLNRPEYIGGSSGSMAISEVLSTAETADAPIGQMGGHGISASGSGNFNYYCEEHGWIIGIINVQPITAYFQGLHRSFGGRFDRLDYPWPTFALIGEQEVLNKEVYVGDDDNEDVFGYIPRYSELRYLPSRVAGEMRSSLDHWHMARKFDSQPSLTEEFISADPTTRIFAVTDPDVDNIYGHLFHQISASRKLPMFGTPAI